MHVQTLQQDIHEAIQAQATRVPATRSAPRILVVPPSTRFARTGGQRNVAFLSVGLSRLGMHVCAFNAPGDNADFLRSEKVCILSPKKIVVKQALISALCSRVGAYKDARYRWRRALAKPEARAAVVTAYRSVTELLRFKEPDHTHSPIDQAISSLDPLYPALMTVVKAQQILEAVVLDRSQICLLDLTQDAMAALLVQFSTPIKLVWYVQNTEQDPEDALLAQHVHVVACSQTALDHKFAAIALRHKAYVVPNGIALSRFSPDRADDSDFRSERRIAKDAIIIGQIAAFQRNKDQMTVLNAFARFVSHEPTACLVFVGGFDDEFYAEKVKAEARKRSLEAHVHFLGDRQDVAQLLFRMDIVVSASHAEGYGLASAEAMVAARPLVMSAIASAKALAGDSALYFPPGDHEQLCERLLLLRDPSARQHFGHRARAHARQHQHSYAAMLRSFADVIDEVAQLPE